MKLFVREGILWKRRATLWILLGTVIVMGHLGYVDYLAKGSWQQFGEYINVSSSTNEEEKEALRDLLAKTVVTKGGSNIMFMVIPLFIVGMSFGKEIRGRNLCGVRLAGMKDYQMFWTSFLVCLVLSLFLAFLGRDVNLWTLRKLWWGRLGTEDMLLLARPVIKIVAEVFFCVSVAFLCFEMLAKTVYVIAYPVYFICAYYLNKIIVLIANNVAYGSNSAPDSQGFRAYFMWDVDQMGLQNGFTPIFDNPISRKIWGEMVMAGYAVAGVILLMAAWFLFRWYYKRKVW